MVSRLFGVSIINRAHISGRVIVPGKPARAADAVFLLKIRL